MPTNVTAEIEIRTQLQRGELREAATAALQLYGPEIYGFLRGTARNDDLAAESFAMLGEDLWRGLPSFRWESSLRSWCYTIARNALQRLYRDPRRKAARHTGVSELQLAALDGQLRTITAMHKRSEVKDEMRELRDQLDPEDHELLLLRLDREMSWKDIARIRGGETDVSTRAAALRKRFERAKERLRSLAMERGLL